MLFLCRLQDKDGTRIKTITTSAQIKPNSTLCTTELKLQQFRGSTRVSYRETAGWKSD